MLKINQVLVRQLVATPPAFVVPSCSYALKANKHYDPKFKRFRALKRIKIELPDFYDREKQGARYEDLTPDEIRAKMKERGIAPPRLWNERQFDISCTSDVFEPYVPPEGDGKLSLVSVGGLKQVGTRIEKKSKSYLTVRKIRSYDEDFDPELFARDVAQDIYIELHKTMARDDGKVDRHKIRTLVTERAYPEVVDNLYSKIIRWDFIESLEPPRVVHARHTSMVTKDNFFAQVTVRFHTKQVLVIYDRFGRICHGNPVTAKDVLEYVVFEKHLSNEYGTWRIHKKIIPEWMEVPPQAFRTYRKVEEPPPEPEKSLPESEESSQASLAQSETSSSAPPRLATA